jgi:hypothetical protein
MKTKDKTKKQMNKDKKIILWEVNSCPAIEIKSCKQKWNKVKSKD